MNDCIPRTPRDRVDISDRSDRMQQQHLSNFVDAVTNRLTACLASLDPVRRTNNRCRPTITLVNICYDELYRFAPRAPSKQKKAFRDAIEALLDRLASQRYEDDTPVRSGVLDAVVAHLDPALVREQPVTRADDDTVIEMSDDKDDEEEDDSDTVVSEEENRRRRRALVATIMDRLGRAYLGDDKFDKRRARDAIAEVFRVAVREAWVKRQALLVDEANFYINMEHHFTDPSPRRSMMKEIEEILPVNRRLAASPVYPAPSADETNTQRLCGEEWARYAMNEKNWLAVDEDVMSSCASVSSSSGEESSSSSSSSEEEIKPVKKKASKRKKTAVKKTKKVKKIKARS